MGGSGGEPVPEGGYDWVKPFEDATGCKTTVKVGASSSEMVQLMKTGQYDGVSASGDATLRLIAGGDVAAIDTSLIPNYANVFEGLKNQPHNTVDGKAYGVPHGRGANLLMFNTDVVKPAPDSWSVVFDGGSAYKGKVTAYDYEIYIADAAVYLMATKPELAITNPVRTRRDAVPGRRRPAQGPAPEHHHLLGYRPAADRLVHQRRHGRRDDLAVPGRRPPGGRRARRGDQAEGRHDGLVRQLDDLRPRPRIPTACTSGWTGSSVRRPMRWPRSGSVRPRSAPQGCAEAEKLSAGHCDLFHATDEEYFKDVYYWNTPTAECLDGRGPICKDFSEWTKAWTEIKG